MVNGVVLGGFRFALLCSGSSWDPDAALSGGSLFGWATLPSCTCTLLIGQVREDSCVDMFNVLFSVLFLCFCSESVRKVLRVCLCYRKDVLD